MKEVGTAYALWCTNFCFPVGLHRLYCDDSTGFLIYIVLFITGFFFLFPWLFLMCLILYDLVAIPGLVDDANRKEQKQQVVTTTVVTAPPTFIAQPQPVALVGAPVAYQQQPYAPMQQPMPPQGYGAPMPPPQGYGAPPQGYGAPPPQDYGMPMPPQDHVAPIGAPMPQPPPPQGYGAPMMDAQPMYATQDPYMHQHPPPPVYNTQ